MLGIGCPDRHALPRITPIRCADLELRPLPRERVRSTAHPRHCRTPGRGSLDLAYHGAHTQDASFNITLERDFAEAIAPIELVPQDITRVCLNLFGNGFYAATKRQKEESDPKFKPTLKVSTRDLGEAVEVQVRDNGVGIPAEIKDKLFQPFFTTKPTGEGTGLGLSISYDIVTQQHGGTISVDSEVGDFTEFTIRLPRTHQTTMAEAAS